MEYLYLAGEAKENKQGKCFINTCGIECVKLVCGIKNK